MALFETTEGDLYRSQRETLSDLLAFIDEHAPNTRTPLPVVYWRLGMGHVVSAELGRHDTDPSGIRADRPAVLAAYAEVFGTEVKSQKSEIKTRYTVKGRIGRREGTAQEPRTQVVLSTDVWHEDDD